MSHTAHAEDGFNELDPHGAQAGHHGHHITGWKTLLGILGILLFFTALTVFVSQGEIWIANTWDIHIPNWVNIVGAMSIATIKAVLVCAIFMQLRYDKALNTIVLLFSIFCVFLFLFFSMIDLGNRDRVAPFRATYGNVGGTGEGLANTIAAEDKVFELAVAPKVSTGGISLVEYRRQQAIEKWPPYLDEGKTQPKYDYKKKPEKYGFAKKYYEDPYYLGENTERGFWHFYYEKTYLNAGKDPHHNPADEAHYFNSFVHDFEHEIHEAGLHAHVEHGPESTAQHSRGRTGKTDAVDRLLHGGEHGHDADHASDHGAGDEHTDDAAHDADHGDSDADH